MVVGRKADGLSPGQERRHNTLVGTPEFPQVSDVRVRVLQFSLRFSIWNAGWGCHPTLIPYTLAGH